jgi:sugar phosphate isomerase/epimerase
MATEYFHPGTNYPLEPIYKNSVFYAGGNSYLGSFKSLSVALDPRTANQVKEVQDTLNTGTKAIEVGNVQPNIFEAIPKEHFKEMQRQAKLAGAELTFHAPMIDPTGITEQGWDKMTQKSAEEQLWSAIKKGAELNEKGTVVTFHATSVGFPSAEFKVKEKGQEKVKSMIAIDGTGRLQLIKEDERYFPTGKKGEVLGEARTFNTEAEVREEFDKKNKEVWSQNMATLTFHAQRISQLTNPYNEEEQDKENRKKLGLGEPEKKHGEFPKLSEENKTFAIAEVTEAYRRLKDLYDIAYKNCKEEKEKRILLDYANEIQPLVQSFEDIKKNENKLQLFAEKITKGISTLNNVNPEIFRPLKDFAIEKSAETTANLAWRAYNEYEKKGKSSPIIALENHPAQQSLLTRGEELKAVVEMAQKNFIEKARAEGISEKKAKETAQKLIGATWDVGHINMLRKYGYSEEDIIEQSKIIAPHVKKIHLSDNFGFEHTELPMGMGNVPMKEILEKIGEKGYDVKKVIEAGDWWQPFSQGGKQNHPFAHTLYPSFSQPYGIPSGYFSGYGTMLPEQHFNLYGSGFTSLPIELGGQIQNKDSRVSGTPMA